MLAPTSHLLFKRVFDEAFEVFRLQVLLRRTFILVGVIIIAGVGRVIRHCDGLLVPSANGSSGRSGPEARVA